MSKQQDKSSPIAELRAFFYCALALAFSAPNKRTLEELSGLISGPLREEGFLLWPALGEGIRMLEASLAGQEKTSNGTLLKAEYHRLFVGPYKLLAPPYASVYLESEPTVMGPSTVKVLRLYEEAGFSLSPSFKDLPDHVAAELEFMALLCEEEGRAWKKGDLLWVKRLLALQETFLSEHLVQWVPKFTAKILAASETPFYRSLAFLSRDCILLDLESVRAFRKLLDAETPETALQERTNGA